ncbi:unnamed protein product [Owenia fusiformis]|uniref:Tetraspanin-31 n=1 Tax=Owenia fusiformis TaxID=6347 RepID=A0A8S4N1V8_OWEFU|nr:unnamed protein product [Owenia fusiformis]
MCGGFTCSKNALVALNVVYILVSFILIGVAATARAVAIVTDITVIGGVIACGVFLLLVAIIGLVGAVKHHQVLLFFYMIILFLLFLIQFAIACACLAVNTVQQENIATQGWMKSSVSMKTEVQKTFDCCGFKEQNLIDEPMGHPKCGNVADCCKSSDAKCCSGKNETTTDLNCPCSQCWNKLEKHMDSALKITGGIGLFFSFTEILGVWLTVRFRNQKDPRANPSAFL